jgi:hypothetical protein
MACQAKQESQEFAMQAVSLEEQLDTTVVPVPIEPSLPIEPENPQQVTKGTAQKTAKPIERKIIRNANVNFQVEEIGPSAKRIETAVKAFNGIITSSEESRRGNDLRHHLTVRVPAAQLDTFLVVLLKESIFTERKTITAEDITKRYVDLEARIKAKKITEEKYLEILKKARNVEEVLKVEEQLGLMREEIETREAELRELKNDVAMSTVNASFYQNVEGVNAPDKPFYAKIWDSFSEGFDLLNGVFLGLFYVLPVAVVFGTIGWFLIRRWRKRRKK